MTYRWLILNRLRAAALLAVWCLFVLPGPPAPTRAQEAPQGPTGESPRRARVLVISNPSGKKIMINGEASGDRTPQELRLQAGPYDITVHGEGFQPLTHGVYLNPGQEIGLEFILLKTPPEPPSFQALRAPPSDPAEAEKETNAAQRAREEADSCLDCHPGIPEIHKEGQHRTLSCSECHSRYDEHVKDGRVVGEMLVIRGNAIQVLCMTCHDREKRGGAKGSAKTVAFPDHLQQKRVRLDHDCAQCHHVHDPNLWVYEARKIVGLPDQRPSQPLLNEIMAVETRRRFNSMAETFLVFPMALGVLGKAAAPEGSDFPANALLVSGAALVAGTYYLGKVFYDKELESIRRINEERMDSNNEAKEYNLRVQRAMNEYRKALQTWKQEAEGRGVVNLRAEVPGGG